MVRSGAGGMLRASCQRLLYAAQTTVVSRATYKHYVMNDTLAQLERHCDQCWPPPFHHSQKVTVLGAGSDVGRIVSLFLKQQNVVKYLTLYDDMPSRGVVGVAQDLAHIDTSTAVQVYQGRTFLKQALYDANLVLICGGNYVMPPCCNIPDRDLFILNLRSVRTAALAITSVCPEAIVVVQTPPVDANFIFIKHTMKQNHVYNKRRLLGVNAISAMRANQLYCKLAKLDPMKFYVPVICGTGRCTRVPVFSACKEFVCMPKKEIEFFVRLVREADDLFCRVKCNKEQGHLSIGFATARFCINVMKGLVEKPTLIDSAFVEQNDKDKCYNMKYCATPVTIGPNGISAYHVPKLNPSEMELLESSKCNLEDILNLGRCYAYGEEYQIHPCLFKRLPKPKICKDCKPCKRSQEQ